MGKVVSHRHVCLKILTMSDNYSYKDEDDLRELYEKYKTLKDVADQFDCSYSNIHYYFDKYDIETNNEHSTVRERDTPETELAPNTECAWCGEEIHKKPYHIRNQDNNFCDNNCHGKWISANRSGENHPQHSKNIDSRTTNKITVSCNNCGNQKEVYPSKYEKQDNFYCNNECQAEFEDRPTRQEKEKVVVVCEWCDNEYDVHPYRVDQTRFCSKDCKDSWMSAEHCGENHPQYKGGDLYYGENWFSIRDQVRERDDGICQYCGTEENELNQKHDVHHIIPVREFDEIKDAHFMENLVQLCRGCHRTIETKSINKQADIFNRDLQNS